MRYMLDMLAEELGPRLDAVLDGALRARARQDPKLMIDCAGDE